MGAMKIVELTPGDAHPPVVADRGVDPIAAGDRQRHAPDLTLVAIEDGSLVARCSGWWTATPEYDGQHVGAIGHYAAADAVAARSLLAHACARLHDRGCGVAIGPMDGTTWRRYRFIVERGAEPPFLLEPDNPDDWPAHWEQAGFAPLASYVSALNDDLTREDARTAEATARLERDGVIIRPFDPARRAVELPRIYRLSLAAFRDNFLYTPIAEDEFTAQYDAILPHVVPELVLLAELDARLVGFLFAIPNLLAARQGRPIDTVILKTLAVDPSMRGRGLGGALMDLTQRRARSLGFRRAIHALIHETNISRGLSARSARPIRRYAVFARPLA